MELSIIVPMYNCEKTIEDTLKCLINQILDDYEIILVDDGSTDQTQSICNKYVQKNSFVKYFFQENSGVSAARNYGLMLSKGTYICFCDSDDKPKEDMYRILLDDIKKNSVDFVSCDYFSIRDQRNPGFPKDLDSILDESRISKYVYYMFNNDNKDVIWGTVWRSIFKKSIINKYNIKFDRMLNFSEDLVFVLNYLLYVKSIYIERRILYVYNDTNDSLMKSIQKYNKNLFDERLKLIFKLQECLEKLNFIPKFNTEVNNIFQEYILECIGNACIKENGNNFFNAYKNVKEIINHFKTIEIFSNINTSIKKRKLIFNFIKSRKVLLITTYYYIRK
mgnify:CR=1 FL=1